MTRDGKLSVKTSLLFSTGDLSISLTLAIQTFFQLYFLTDVARLDPATVGWILGITRFWDAVNDPLIGMVSDRMRTRWGRRRVLLAFGSIPLGLFFALCWMVPPLGTTGLAIYYTLIIIAFDTAFTVVHVGYNALTPEMTCDYDERSRLNGIRMVISLGGSLAALVFATLLAQYTTRETVRFAIVGITLGLIAIVPPWVVFRVAGSHCAPGLPSKMAWARALKTTLTNRAFVMLMLMYLASWTATCVIAAMLIYFANYCLLVPDQANYFPLVAQASAVASVPLSVFFANRWDKPRAFIVGILYWAIVLGVFFVVPGNAVVLAYAFAILCGPGIATAAVIPWSMLPDVVESEQETTGERREGAYYSLASFFQKLGIGVAMWGIGQTLSASGYVTPNDIDPFPLQPDSVVSTIRFIIGPVTIGLLLLSVPFAWRYPINREAHQRRIEYLRTTPADSGPDPDATG